MAERRAPDTDDLALGVRFVRELVPFLRRPLTVEQGRALLARRLREREDDFLRVAREAVYAQAASPYRRLLEHAGCAYGDLEALVRAEGVEGALGRLFAAGVYLTVEEMKGRRPVARGSLAFDVSPAALRNPRASSSLPARSSGSRGAATPVPITLGYARDVGVSSELAHAARGARAWVQAVWAVPGGAALARLLRMCTFGDVPARWFTQTDVRDPALHPRYRWSARALRWGSLLAGVPLPAPVYVPIERPLPIARWMAAVLAAGRTPFLITGVTSAIRVCSAATEAGISLAGAQLSVGGEPVTATRLDAIRRSGATPVPHYASIEAGPIAEGCLRPDQPDDLHLFHDLHGVIQPERAPDGAPLPAGSLFISSLRPTARMVLLNASLGDHATLERRACGCPLEELGWATHLHTIRSHDKLTGAGMTFLDADVVRVLDVALPAAFGGGPTDYQLVEQEGPDGRPQLRLLVDPRVGPVHPEAIRDRFLAEIGRGEGAEHVMGTVWRQADLLTVERRAPYATFTGKILHLHRGP